MNQQRQQQQSESSRDQVHRAIHEGGRALVELAERVGKQAKNQGLTTNQIRNIYGLVKKMEMDYKMGREFSEHRLMMLKPKMAYAAARASGSGAKTLANVLSQAIDAVGSDASKFPRFVDLFEAILAYHKAEGGK